jgi:hypothetical protein
MNRQSKKFDGKCFYSMETLSINGKYEVYADRTWLGLGWRIFKFRLYHLIKHGKWAD